MSEELKAIDFLRAKTITYELSSEELHYSLILYNLIMNLQRENEKLKEQLKQKEDIINKANNFIKEYEKNRNCFKWNEEDYIDVINEIKQILDNKGE